MSAQLPVALTIEERNVYVKHLFYEDDENGPCTGWQHAFIYLDAAAHVFCPYSGHKSTIALVHPLIRYAKDPSAEIIAKLINYTIIKWNDRKDDIPIFIRQALFPDLIEDQLKTECRKSTDLQTYKKVKREGKRGKFLSFILEYEDPIPIKLLCSTFSISRNNVLSYLYQMRKVNGIEYALQKVEDTALYSCQVMEYLNNATLLYLKAEHFNKNILGVNLAKLTQYQASVVITDKFAHAKEEYTELAKAIKRLHAKQIEPFYEYLDACIDLDYVLNGILFLDRRAQMGIHNYPNFKTYKNAISTVKRNIADVPYMYAYNLVHRANMAKHRGNVVKRTVRFGFDAVKPFGWKPPSWPYFFKKHVLMPKPKIAILGYSDAGKDTMAEILRDWYGYKYTQATRFILEKFLWGQFSLYGKYETFDEAYEDRINCRQLWYDMICEINKENPATIANAIYAESDIYCGIRSCKELEAAYDTIDRIYWINCGERIPIESGSNDIHADLLYKDAKWRNKLVILQNHESLMKFKVNIYKEMSHYE